MAVLASVYGVCSSGGSPGGNHLYLQSLKPPHTRNFQNFHFRNTTNLGRLLGGRRREIEKPDVDEIQMRLESILKQAVSAQDVGGF